MNVVLKRLRDAVSWFRDIDYKRTEDIDYDATTNIDWLDDFDPNEPRKPKGGPGGGQWTAAGGAAAAANVPTPGTIQVGKQGSAKKLAEYIKAQLISGTDPQEVAKKLKEYGANYNYSGYAGYANQLLKHVEAAHGLAPGSLGKAVNKVAAALSIAPSIGEAKEKIEATAASTFGGPEAEPPTDAEIEKWAQEAEAAIALIPEPATTEALPAVPDLPPPGSHDNVQKIAEIVGNKWTPEEKVAWIEALAGDIPPEDAAGQAYVQGQIAKLKGGDVPVSSGNLPQVPVSSGAAPAMPKVPASWATPAEPASGGTLDPPVLKTQTKIYDIFHHAKMSNAVKIDAINAMLVSITHQPNIDYANQALALLKAQQPQAASSPVQNQGPAPQTGLQGALMTAATDPGTVADKFKAMQEVINSGLLLETDASFKFAQKWAETIMQGGGAMLKPYVEPAASSPVLGDLDKVLTPAEQKALEQTLPMPGGTQAEQDLWETAAMKNWTAASKIKQLEADMTQGGIASKTEPSLMAGQVNAYAQTLIDHLKGSAYLAPSPAASPDTTMPPGPVASIAQPVAITEPVGQLKNSVYAMGAYQIAIGPEDPKTKAASIVKLISKAVLAGTLKEDSIAYNHALGMAVTLNQQVTGGASPTSQWPQPSNGPQQTLLNNIMATATVQEQHQLLNNIATSIASPELKAYAAKLKAALGPDPSAAQPTAKLTGKPLPLPPTASSGVQANMLKKVEAATTQAEKEAILAGYVKGGYSPETEGYAKTLLAAVQAEGAVPAADPTQPPAPPGMMGAAGYNLHGMATSGLNTAAQLQDYVDSNFLPGSTEGDWANSVVAWKKAQEGGGATSAALPPIPSHLDLNAETLAAFNIAQFGTIGNPDKLAALEDYHQKAIASNLQTPGSGGYEEQSAVGHYVQSLIDALKGGASGAAPGAVMPIPDPEPNNSLHNSMWQTAINPKSTTAEKIEAVKLFAVTAPTNQKYKAALLAALTSQPGGPTGIAPATPAHQPLIPPHNYTNKQQQLFNIANDPVKSVAEKISLMQAVGTYTSEDLAYYNSVVAAMGGAPPTSAPSIGATPAKPTIPSPGAPSVQGSMHALATDPNTTNAEKILKIVTFPISAPVNVKYKVAVLQALGAPLEDLIPHTPNGPTTLQGKVYKAATSSLTIPTKIANVKALTLNTKAGQKYQNAVVAALEALEAGPATPQGGYSPALVNAFKAGIASGYVAPPTTPAAKEAPKAPPPLPMAAAGSNTQEQMYLVGAANPIAGGGLNNPEKIAEITKILANSSGGEGGKAEQYANSLITALGGQATTKSKAVAAQPQAAPTTYGGGGAATPAGGTPGKSGGPPLRSASAKILARGEKIWNAAKKISGYAQPASSVVAPSVEKSFWKTVSGAVRSAVKDYTDSGSSAVNEALRDMSTAGQSVAEQIHKIEDAFDMPGVKLTEDVILTRGVDLPQKEIDGYMNGLKYGLPTHYIMQGYGSSSMHPTTPAFHTRKVYLEMVCRKGTKALGVAAISSHPENELLLEHGQMFDIHEIREEGGKIKIRMVSIPKADTGDRAWRKKR